jgi:hypothetical protein
LETTRPLVLLLLSLSLASTVASRADDAPPVYEGVKTAPATADNPPKVRSRHGAAGRTPAEAINETVRRMTRALDLNVEQQLKLREILMEQHRDILKLRTDGGGPGTDRVAMSAAIVDRIKSRIRAMLTDEQKTKYMSDVPFEQTALAQADLQHWLDIQDAKRREGADESK